MSDTNSVHILTKGDRYVVLCKAFPSMRSKGSATAGNGLQPRVPRRMEEYVLW
jgi:hypothetical protein